MFRVSGGIQTWVARSRRTQSPSAGSRCRSPAATFESSARYSRLAESRAVAHGPESTPQYSVLLEGFGKLKTVESVSTRLAMASHCDGWNPVPSTQFEDHQSALRGQLAGGRTQAGGAVNGSTKPASKTDCT